MDKKNLGDIIREHLLVNIPGKYDEKVEALVAVLDIHQPFAPPPEFSWVSGGNTPHCEGCDYDDPFMATEYPCPTVKAIAEVVLHERD